MQRGLTHLSSPKRQQHKSSLETLARAEQIFALMFSLCLWRIGVAHDHSLSSDTISICRCIGRPVPVAVCALQRRISELCNDLTAQHLAPACPTGLSAFLRTVSVLLGLYYSLVSRTYHLTGHCEMSLLVYHSLLFAQTCLCTYKRHCLSVRH